MKVAIEVENREQAEAVRVAWQDPQVRAFVITIGILAPLSNGAKRRILNYVADWANDRDHIKLTTTTEDGAPAPALTGNGGPD